LLERRRAGLKDLKSLDDQPFGLLKIASCLRRDDDLLAPPLRGGWQIVTWLR
jgi:hypothetical protein